MKSLRRTETDPIAVNSAIRDVQRDIFVTAELTAPVADRLAMFDASAGSVKFAALADITTEAAPAADDFIIVQRAEDEIVKVNWDHLPGFGGGLSNIVEDLSPTLGGNLDGNAFSLGTVGSAAADVFLESGGVINWSSGDVTITHSGGLLTFSDPVTLGTSNSLTCGSIELGAAADTTLTRTGAGVAAVEGKNIYVAGGADVALADGGTGATLADPALDRLMVWDDSATTVKFAALADLNTEAAPAAGDFLIVQRAEDDIVKVNWNTLPGFGGGLSNVSDDTSPTLGGNLDGNTFSIGTVSSPVADVFLESGGVINWNAGDVTVTHAANALDVAGGNVNFDSITLDAPLAVAQGGTGQVTEAEAIGEMIQALTEDTSPDFSVDFVATYDSSADTGKKVKLSTILMTDWTRVIKILDESLTSNATLQDDDILTFPVAANTKYSFRMVAFYTTGATGDFKYGITTPVSPTFQQYSAIHTFNIDAPLSFTASTITSVSLTGTSTAGTILIDAIIHNGANAGSVTFQWAQNTSNATATIVRAGSYLEYIVAA